jgi:acetylornithine deacetylase/succinyl-diaminopimelate desuccinylase-like protein
VHYRTTFPYHPPKKRPELNAIRKMAKVISAIDESILTYKKDERFGGLPSVVIGKIEGGVGPQFTAPSCTITVDIRMVPGMTADSIKKDLDRAISKLMGKDPELKATVEMKTRVDLPEGEGPRFYPSDPYLCSWDEPIVQSIRKAHKDLTGKELGVAGIFDTMLGSSRTDALIMIEAGIPTTIYGPFAEDMGGGAGVDQAALKIDDLTDTCTVIALAALDFVTKKK